MTASADPHRSRPCQYSVGNRIAVTLAKFSCHTRCPRDKNWKKPSSLPPQAMLSDYPDPKHHITHQAIIQWTSCATIIFGFALELLNLCSKPFEEETFSERFFLTSASFTRKNTANGDTTLHWETWLNWKLAHEWIGKNFGSWFRIRFSSFFTSSPWMSTRRFCNVSGAASHLVSRHWPGYGPAGHRPVWRAGRRRPPPRLSLLPPCMAPQPRGGLLHLRHPLRALQCRHHRRVRRFLPEGPWRPHRPPPGPQSYQYGRLCHVLRLGRCGDGPVAAAGVRRVFRWGFRWEWRCGDRYGTAAREDGVVRVGVYEFGVGWADGGEWWRRECTAGWTGIGNDAGCPNVHVPRRGWVWRGDGRRVGWHAASVPRVGCDDGMTCACGRTIRTKTTGYPSGLERASTIATALSFDAAELLDPTRSPRELKWPKQSELKLFQKLYSGKGTKQVPARCANAEVIDGWNGRSNFFSSTDWSIDWLIFSR